MLSESSEVDDAKVAVRLQSSHVLTLAFSEQIAIFGFVLYMFSGERYDLYGFGLVTLINLILLRPTRDRWNELYRQTAIQHPGISSQPL